MTEVLNISVTGDARELFIQHDVATIKKIRQTAKDEIEHKKTVLRQFIGENYRPLMKAPPILQQIQEIFEESKETLRQLESFGQNYPSFSTESKPPPPPISVASQAYLDSLKALNKQNFKNSFDLAIKSAQALDQTEHDAFYFSFKCGVDALPFRIFNAIDQFLNLPSSKLTSDCLLDCYYTILSIYAGFPALFAKKNIENPKIFIEHALVSRVKSFIQLISNIPDLCSAFIDLIDSIIAFLANVNDNSLNTLIQIVIDNYKASFVSGLPQFSKSELREILKYSKSCEDALRNRISTPQFVSNLSEIGIKVDFWREAFLPIFRSLAAQSIKYSVISLDLKDNVKEILQMIELANFKSSSFVLNHIGDLKMKSIGMSPVFTEFQTKIDTLIISLTSQMQSQTSVVNIKMLQKIMNAEIASVSTIMSNSIMKSPLVVCLLAKAICSPSIESLLPDAVRDLLDIQRKAANEWATRKANESKLMLQSLPQKGLAFTYLVEMERVILDAGGHVHYHPLDECLRESIKVVVNDVFISKLQQIGQNADTETRKINETNCALLFEDYCLFERVLSIRNTKNIRQLFAKQIPLVYEEVEQNAKKMIDSLLATSGELIKLISNGIKSTAEKPSVEIIAKSHLDMLFPNRKE